ncbi:MAG TPA: hypothetical protein VE465_14900 [Streptosporangiaceae bacterium]|jgi:sulfopyruvate decarboxylase TPP-binding subunit|nr:hypothetical protein [Streptosporangiaceae bacterium]
MARLIDRLEQRGIQEYVVREDPAVGMAAGACLVGCTPVVAMQNSGLGQSVNALASLVLPYRLPILLVIGMRGTDEDDTSENLVMGGITRSLLESLTVPARSLPAEWPQDAVAAAADEVRTGRASALLVSPGLFGWSAAS